MSAWACAGLLVLGAVLYTLAVVGYIRADNRPPKRWPGDP